MAEPVWVVLKAGVYLQGVFGPFADVAGAAAACDRLAARDKDCYHTWSVAHLTDAGLGEAVYRTHGPCNSPRFHQHHKGTCGGR